MVPTHRNGSCLFVKLNLLSLGDDSHPGRIIRIYKKYGMKFLSMDHAPMTHHDKDKLWNSPVIGSLMSFHHDLPRIIAIGCEN